MQNMKKNKGLTLIELVMVIAMTSIISLALYSTFSSGIKIWQKVNTVIPNEDLSIFFDKFTTDLRNSLKFTGIKFSGTDTNVGFATLVNSLTMNMRTVGEVIYRYDSNKETLVRSLRDFSQVYTNDEGSSQQLSKNIKSLKFLYYTFDTERKEYVWQEDWLDGEFPLAVRIELDFYDGAKINNFTKTVSIPVSG
jgi:prepilin-type N-terminal cleavage/methylation domain-containing protein